MGSGPLNGVRVLEFAGIGPGPYAGMLLADMGAEVVRIDRKGAGGRGSPSDITGRGKRSIGLDLKDPSDIEVAKQLLKRADVLLEGFRPMVMERLGLGPEDALSLNPKLVYGRITGWGQTGPLSQAAGHDLNYIALTGALHAMGRPGQPPTPPLNLVGDYGGGSMFLLLGVLAALFEAQRSGKGQVIDAAMTDGAASLAAMFYGMRSTGMWSDQRGANLLDGGAHFYDCYECSDGRYVAIGSIEPQFYALLLDKAGLVGDDAFKAQMDRKVWPELKAKLAALIKTKTRDEWSALMEGTDVCFGPVLSMAEAPEHAHNKARQTFVTIEGVTQPNVAPRFSGTPSKIQGPAPAGGADTEAVLSEWGVRR